VDPERARDAPRERAKYRGIEDHRDRYRQHDELDGPGDLAGEQKEDRDNSDDTQEQRAE
jgi:hypothetical protein